jgi:hypothetical protein
MVSIQQNGLANPGKAIDRRRRGRQQPQTLDDEMEEGRRGTPS